MNKEKLKEEVKEISELEKNWDGYDAEPFTQKIIDKVNEVVDCLDGKYKDPCIVPSNCGIQFEWENGKNSLEIYVEEEGLSYLKVIGEHMSDWKETKFSDMGEIGELLKWLYKKN